MQKLSNEASATQSMLQFFHQLATPKPHSVGSFISNSYLTIYGNYYIYNASAMFEFRRLYCARAKLHAPFPFDGLLSLCIFPPALE